MRYWITAWVLVLIHFIAQLASGNLAGIARKFVVSVSTSALELAGVVLLLSLSITFEDRKINRCLGAIIAVPLLIYVNCLVWEVSAHWIYLLCVVATTAGSLLLYILFLRRLSVFLLLITGWCVFTAVWLIRDVQTGGAVLILHYSLTGLYGISGLLFWRIYRRFSAGVIVSSFGLLAWAAVFPTATFLATHYPAIVIHRELWNIPKFFVAIGMLLTLMEDQSIGARALAFNYKSLFELNLAAVYRITLDGRLLDCNPAFLRMFGFASRSEALATNAQDLYVLPERRQQYVRDLCERGCVNNYEIEQRKRDGTPFWISESAALIDTAESPVILGTAVDITPKKEAESAFRRSEERFSTVFRRSPIVCAILRLEDGVFLDVNDTFLKIMHKSKDEVLGKTGLDLGFWKDREQRNDFVRRLRLHGSIQNLPVTFRDGKGKQREGLYSADCADVGGVECVIGMMTDVTDYKALEEHLRRTQKLEAIGGLAAGIAHDFNNILGIIQGFGELVALKVRDLPKTAKHTQNILETVSRGSELTRRLLTFSSNQPLQKTRFNADEAVLKTAGLLVPLLGEDVILSIVTESRQMVEMDPGQFEQLIVNLAVNARDAMPRGGQLHIRTSFESNGPSQAVVRLAVSDTGCGMDEVTKRRLFEPFFTTKGVGKGTGLGLATVYGIVRQIGGNITVESQEGAGSTFTLHIPSVGGGNEKPVPEQASATEAGAGLIGPGGILLVEDEVALRNAVYEFLVECGYNVRVAGNGKEALAIARTFTDEIKLVITDVVMPEMSGFDLVQELKREARPFEYLFVSGYADDTILQYGVKTSGVPFLQKPYSFAKLVAMIRELMNSEKPETPAAKVGN